MTANLRIIWRGSLLLVNVYFRIYWIRKWKGRRWLEREHLVERWGGVAAWQLVMKGCYILSTEGDDRLYMIGSRHTCHGGRIVLILVSNYPPAPVPSFVSSSCFRQSELLLADHNGTLILIAKVSVWFYLILNFDLMFINFTSRIPKSIIDIVDRILFKNFYAVYWNILDIF